MELRTSEVRIEDMKDITRQVTWNINNLRLYDYPYTWFDEWESLKGEFIQPGRVTVRGGVKYLYIGTQQIMVSDHVPPDTISSRNLYRPIQGRDNIYRWIYGETIYGGFKREYEGKIYQSDWDISHDENIITPDLSDIWYEISGA